MNSYGNQFRISIFGESHSPLVGIHIDGVPAGISLAQDDFMPDLLRRKSGAMGTTPRIEGDLPEIVCGIMDGVTTGAPLVIIFRNTNVKDSDYDLFRETPRPGHADYVSSVKYNFFNDIRGGGQFSGRMTLALVAAGVVAKKIIAPMEVSARIVEAGGIPVEGAPLDNEAFAGLLRQTLREKDSLGGIIECRCRQIPVGLGEPFFDSLESQIAHLVFSIPGIRGIEFGDGFQASRMKGSEHNDCFIDKEGHTAKNGAGGINGGISNGNDIVFRIAAKPTSSIGKAQHSFNFITQQMEEVVIPGRHDACFALRVPVIVESVAAIVLCNNRP